MRSSILSLAMCAVTLCAAGQAAADETGMASIHTWRRVDGKTCLIDHQHNGSGSGPNQAVAMREAIKAWQSFTDFEYGSDWASYGMAIEKQVSCGKSLSDITCNIDATPCRAGSIGRTERSTRRARR